MKNKHNISKRFCIIVFVLLVQKITCASSPIILESGDYGNEIIDVIRNVYRYQLSEPVFDDSSGWKNATFFAGLMAAYEVTKDKECLDAALNWAEKFSWKLSGQLTRHADYHCCAQTYLDLYLLDEALQQRYADSVITFDNIINNFIDFNCGGVSSDTWSWADALFMAPPVLPRLSLATGDTRYIALMHQMWSQTELCLYDEEANLFYRDSRFIGTQVGGEKVFWSRGNGWVMAGIVRVLDVLPQEDTHREHYIDLLREMAQAVSSTQGSDGMWRANLLYPAQYPNPETSGTAFFCYSIAWAINHGYLAAESYGQIVEDAWNGMLDIALHGNGKVGYVQGVSDRPDEASYEDQELYGTGAFLLAASEMYRYFESQSSSCLASFSGADISENWIDGNTNGSTSLISPSGITDGAMKIAYNNSVQPYIGKVEREFSIPINLSNESFGVISFFVKGKDTNSQAVIYLRLEDSNGNIWTQSLSQTSFVANNMWAQLNFDINEFKNIDLSHITNLTIGIGNGIYSNASGEILIDGLYIKDFVCLNNEMVGDINNDCKVDIVDFAAIAKNWLDSYFDAPEPVEPNFSQRTCYYTFNETGGGFVSDSSGNNNNGSAFFTNWQPDAGKVDGAVSLEGSSYSNSRINTPATAFSSSAGSVAMWVYLYEQQDYTATRYIFAQNKPISEASEWGNRMQIYLENDNTLRLGLGDSHYLAPEVAILAVNKWSHLVLNWAAGNYEFYVNGHLRTSGSYTGLNGFQTAHIGNNASIINPNQPFNGMVDEFMVFSYNLTNSEVAYLAESLPKIDKPQSNDIYTDGIINIGDIKLFINNWTDNHIWPPNKLTTMEFNTKYVRE